MKPIPTMINGLPGQVATTIAGHIMADPRLKLLPWSLTGPEITASTTEINGIPIQLVKPGDRDTIMPNLIKDQAPFISVDYTHPSAINDNCEFYCRHGLPFVMGTTGGYRDELATRVEASDISAVIAPNMAKQIVGFQAMMAHAAENFPDMFKGYSLTLTESHQKGKADTSGTARAMVKYFQALGVDFTETDIIKIRDPEIQQKEWGIPEEYLSGHGWHTYTLLSPDRTVKFEFTHNVNGRDIYAGGTIDAVLFLEGHIRDGSRGRVFSMIDVLKGI
ncbi:MAG: dihydrodipicolinate reductase [Desulfosudaceae bacterium]